MKSAHVFIIHGFMASPTDHWFQWLRSELESKGVSARVLNLPDSHSPDAEVWQKTLATDLGELNENSYVIAHSLGSVSLLKYLQTRKSNQQIGGMVLVSGFVDPLPTLPQLDNFIEGNIDFKRIIDVVPARVVIGSPQDPIVPFSLTKNLAHNLDARLYSIDDAGHFLADDGYVRFPQLYDVLMQIIHE